MPLVELVEAERGDAVESGILLHHPREDPLCHDLDPRACAHPAVVPHAIPHRLADRLAEEPRHLRGSGPRGESPRLEHEDPPLAAPGSVEECEGDSRRLPGTRRGDDHRRTLVLERRHDPPHDRIDREGREVSKWGRARRHSVKARGRGGAGGPHRRRFPPPSTRTPRPMHPRRDFLRQASLIAAGGVAASSPLGAMAPMPDDTELVQGNWDMSWVDRITGKYRIVFDAPEVKDGVCLHQARSFLSGYQMVHGLTDADLTAVLVIRHSAVPMVMGDALWSDGAFGEKEKLKDPVSGEPTKRNPFINIPAGATHALTWPDGALDTLMKRGVIVLACSLALDNFASQIASRRKIPRQDAKAMVTESLLPGVIRMPSGIFATCRAQAAGCGFMYAG